MAHVGQRCNSRLVHEPLYPKIDHSVVKKCYLSQFYWDAEKAITMNAPKSQGKKVDICMLMGSDHL